MKQRITLLGKQIRTQQLQKLIHNTIHDAETLYQQVHNAIQHGIPPTTARNLPQPQLARLTRYERALQLYDDYKHHYNTPRADRILIPAKPTTTHHIAHFICASTSDKQTHTYTPVSYTHLTLPTIYSV